MTREYLIHYIINFFESYIKQKEPAQIPAVYFMRYLVISFESFDGLTNEKGDEEDWINIIKVSGKQCGAFTFKLCP